MHETGYKRREDTKESEYEASLARGEPTVGQSTELFEKSYPDTMYVSPKGRRNSARLSYQRSPLMTSHVAYNLREIKPYLEILYRVGLIFLCCSRSSYVTGSGLIIDGGTLVTAHA